MINLRSGDILHADVEALVNTVNCVGVMGRGIALQFRKAFPDNYRAYKSGCERELLKPGKVFVFDLNRLHNPRYIINFPTKRHWRGKSRIEDIQAGLNDLVKELRLRGINSVAVPPLGCGLGGLEWDVVHPLIENAFHALEHVEVFLYEPGGGPGPEEMVKEEKAPSMTIGRAVLIGLMRRYLAAVMDPTVTLLEIHKLMYFMQEAGEGLKLKFEKGPYGPYATNLRHVLNLIEGHFIVGFGDAADDPLTPIEPQPEGLNLAEKCLEDHAETTRRLNRVTDLICGFESSFGLELLATVHWAATREQATTERDVVERTYSWNPRKRMFEEDHIKVAWNLLAERGWLGEARLPLS